MDLNEIREIIEQDGGKFIIVENGKPVLVIMGFNEYKGKISVQGACLPEGQGSASGGKKLDNSITTESIPEEGIQPEELPKQNDEVDIDDLPLD